jgi:hypothetical protein
MQAIPKQTELRTRQYAADFYVLEFTNGSFIQSWGPYESEQAAADAACHISTFDFFLGHNVYVFTPLRRP